MNKQTQRKFARRLIGSIQKEILEKSGKWPKEWDGVELRWLIADAFRKVVWSQIGSRSRKMAYNNEVMVRNIL